MEFEEEIRQEISVLKAENQKISDGFVELVKSIDSLVVPLTKAQLERDTLTAKQKKDEEEDKMFNRFVKQLKAAGVTFARKEDVTKQGKVTTAQEQRGGSHVTNPEGQQAVIQGQEGEAREEEKPPEYPEVKAETEEEEEEPEEKACNDKTQEDSEVEKLRKENATLTSKLAEVQNSVTTEVEKAVEKKLQEFGWKSLGHTPVKIAAQETMILKSEKPISKEEFITQLKKLPLAQLNDMNMRYQMGEFQLPAEVLNERT